jgi:AraC-like DNA-binding protein
MRFNIVSFTILLGVFQSLFMALLLFRAKSDRAASNRVLAALLMVIALLLSSTALFLAGFPDADLIRLVMTAGFFAIGPLFLRYLKRYAGASSALSAREAAHALPSILSVAYYLPKYFLPGWLPFISYRFMTFFFWNAFLLHIMVYLFIAARLTRTGRNSDDGWLGFLFKFFSATFAVITAVTAYDMVRIILGFGGIRLVVVGIALLGVFLICAVSFEGLAHPEVFFGPRQKPGGRKPDASLDPSRREEVLKAASRLMETEKPYLDPGLTLPALAAMIGVSRGDLSAAINAGTGRNFYDYVNGYRIAHAARLLTELKAMNVLDVAYESGFLSKSTFNDAFKRETGLTPTEYRKRS